MQQLALNWLLRSPYPTETWRGNLLEVNKLVVRAPQSSVLFQSAKKLTPVPGQKWKEAQRAFLQIMLRKQPIGEQSLVTVDHSCAEVQRSPGLGLQVFKLENNFFYRGFHRSHQCLFQLLNRPP